MRRSTRVQPSATRRSSRPFCPDVGDFVWVDFNPQSGREQAGRRPALVLSPRQYNERANLCVVCAITSQVKGYPFEVALPESEVVARGAILADQLKSISWQARSMASAGGKASGDVVEEVKAKIAALLRLD